MNLALIRRIIVSIEDTAEMGRRKKPLQGEKEGFMDPAICPASSEGTT